MNWLKAQIEFRGITPRQIGLFLGYRNGSRISEYLTLKRVPGPEVIRKIGPAIGVSPIEALSRAGYYDVIIDGLRQLYQRGWFWCQRDNVGFDTDRGALFYPTFQKHTKDLRFRPPELKATYHEGIVFGKYLNGDKIQYVASVPMPIAIAVFIAIGLFPRRGDVLREGADKFAHGLSSLAEPILEENWVNPNTNRPHFRWRDLDNAIELFKDRHGNGALTGALCAEYVQSWADTVCRGYANYARLALYKHGGHLPYGGDGVGNGDDPWSYQYVNVPQIGEFSSSYSQPRRQKPRSVLN